MHLKTADVEGLLQKSPLGISAALFGVSSGGEGQRTLTSGPPLFRSFFSSYVKHAKVSKNVDGHITY